MSSRVPGAARLEARAIYRTLTESELFSKQHERLTACYPMAVPAFDGLTFLISRNPEAFDPVPGNESYRLARSHRTRGNGREVPRIRILFQIVDEDRVLLCAVSAEE